LCGDIITQSQDRDVLEFLEEQLSIKDSCRKDDIKRELEESVRQGFEDLIDKARGIVQSAIRAVKMLCTFKNVDLSSGVALQWGEDYDSSKY
jgi:hypothetical protein